MPMNVKEVDNFFGDQLAIFRPNFVQNCEFHFSSKMLNFVISFIFRTIFTTAAETARKIQT